MFSLEKSFGLSKKIEPDLVPEENVFQKKEETDFLKHVPVPFSNVKFVELGSKTPLTFKPTQVHATEEELYENNGGTTLTIVLNDKIIIASDTRHSSEYTINSRKMTRIYKIGDYFLTAVGFFADGFEVYTKLQFLVKEYESYDKISLAALAHLLHNILYTRRFFPLYVYCCVSGFVDGVPKMYSYDPVGSYQESKCRCDGSGSRMIQPLLDSWVMGKNFKGFAELDFESSLALVKKAFSGAAERDVKTKDFLEIYVVEKDKVKHEFVELRKD